MTKIRFENGIDLAKQAGQDVVDRVVHRATVDPTVTDDTAHGYMAGQIWRNTTSGDTFVCTSATNGAAVWAAVASGGGGGSGTITGGTNVGTGAAPFKDVSGGDTMRFRRINAGTNVTVTENANDITIDASGGGSGDVEYGYTGDARPASPSAYDDEFDGSSLNGTLWPTVLDDGSGNTYSVSKSQLVVRPASGGKIAFCQAPGIPSGDWTAACKVWFRPLTNYAGLALSLRSSASGTVIGMGCYHDTNVKVEYIRWAPYTTFSANQFVTDHDTKYDSRCYLQLAKVGTTLHFRFSLDGKYYTEIGTESITAIVSTLDQFCLHVAGPAVSGGAIIVDWFRVS